MTGDAFIALAGNLLVRDRTPSDALRRTIVGRAYYGAFHLATAFLNDLGFTSGRNHADFRRMLYGSLHPDAVRVSDIIGQLQTYRVAADYDLQQARFDDLKFVQQCVEDARDVQSLLADCTQEPARTAVKTGIEAYRQRIAGKV